MKRTRLFTALLLTGGIATAAAFFVQTYVQQRLSAVETGMIILTEPIFAAIFRPLNPSLDNLRASA